MSSEAAAFTDDGGRVRPGETAHVRYTVSETYLGDPVRMPVTIVNGVEPNASPCKPGVANDRRRLA